VEGQGRGLVAAQAVRAGQRVLQVPETLIITPAAAARRSALAPALTAGGPPLPAWSVLALWLMETMTAASHTGASDAAYAAVLPAPGQTGCVLEWSPQEVAWLQGSHLAALAADIRAAAAASWLELSAAVAAAEAAGAAVPAGVYTQSAATHAFALLLSRLVRLDGAAPDGGALEALCPWADLVNHACDATSFLSWDPAARAVVLAADRTYSPGEQVVASYGQKTSGELLLSYGFAPPEGSNPHDACLLRMDACGGGSGAPAERGGWKAAALRRRGASPDRAFPLRLGALPEGLLRFACFAAAAPAGAEEAEALCEALFPAAGHASDASLPPALLLEGLEAAAAAVRRALVGYSITLEGGKAELAGLHAAGRGGTRRAAVLQVLVQEQRVLSRAAFLLASRLRETRLASRQRAA
jgi:histone-lysine N-methyltransferase SETD3